VAPSASAIRCDDLLAATSPTLDLNDEEVNIMKLTTAIKGGPKIHL